MGSKPSTPDRFGTVLQVCMEAAQQIIIILESLHAQGLLGKQDSTLAYQAVTKTKY